MSKPKLVLVAGAPGTGKTTLADVLGDELPAPVLGKDAIKEGISLTEGARASWPHRATRSELRAGTCDGSPIRTR